jgi:pyrroloquinoline quinone (PQQ) biosynthesis protein C
MTLVGERVRSKFIEDLKKEIHAHPAMTHSFLKKFGEGKIRPEAPKIFAEQYYQFSKHFSRYLAAVISIIPEEPAREPLIKNLYEEYGGRAEEQKGMDLELVHANLFRKFCKSAGANLETTKPFPETSLFVERYLYRLREIHWIEALGALGPGTEYIVPYFYKPILDGLKKSKKFTDNDLLFFEAHITLDVEHGENIWDSIEPYSSTPEQQQLLRTGTYYALDARKVLWDGLERACCL